jgi:uncharacterized protein with PQ loop repeat
MRKPTKKRIAIIDDLSYVAIFAGIFMTLPQVLKIWVEKESDGVSVTTWVSYTVLGVFWVYYGLVHNEKPIIVGNVLGLLLNVAIVVGLLWVK